MDIFNGRYGGLYIDTNRIFERVVAGFLFSVYFSAIVV